MSQFDFRTLTLLLCSIRLNHKLSEEELKMVAHLESTLDRIFTAVYEEKLVL